MKFAFISGSFDVNSLIRFVFYIRRQFGQFGVSISLSCTLVCKDVRTIFKYLSSGLFCICRCASWVVMVCGVSCVWEWSHCLSVSSFWVIKTFPAFSMVSEIKLLRTVVPTALVVWGGLSFSLWYPVSPPLVFWYFLFTFFYRVVPLFVSFNLLVIHTVMF